MSSQLPHLLSVQMLSRTQSCQICLSLTLLCLSDIRTYAARTPVFPIQNAGVPQSSMASSIDFSRALLGFQPGSDINKGCSANGFSSASTSSICTSASPLVPTFSPFLLAGVCRCPVNRDVMLNSHSFAARSQSSTNPSDVIGFLISKPGRGV